MTKNQALKIVRSMKGMNQKVEDSHQVWVWDAIKRNNWMQAEALATILPQQIGWDFTRVQEMAELLKSYEQGTVQHRVCNLLNANAKKGQKVYTECSLNIRMPLRD